MVLRLIRSLQPSTRTKTQINLDKRKRTTKTRQWAWSHKTCSPLATWVTDNHLATKSQSDLNTSQAFKRNITSNTSTNQMWLSKRTIRLQGITVRFMIFIPLLKLIIMLLTLVKMLAKISRSSSRNTLSSRSSRFLKCSRQPSLLDLAHMIQLLMQRGNLYHLTIGQHHVQKEARLVIKMQGLCLDQAPMSQILALKLMSQK